MPRRRPRRPSPPLAVRETDDLIALLLEQTAPSTPEAWFSAPWRHGKNAIRLAVELAKPFSGMVTRTARCSTNRDSSELEAEVEDFLRRSWDANVSPDLVYWEGTEFRSAIRLDESLSPHVAFALDRTLIMFLRLVANSDGGDGLSYNWHLQAICENKLAHGGDVAEIEVLVRRARARDVVGLGLSDPEPQDATTQRRLAAFETAWRAGLFKMAFCV